MWPLFFIFCIPPPPQESSLHIVVRMHQLVLHIVVVTRVCPNRGTHHRQTGSHPKLFPCPVWLARKEEKSCSSWPPFRFGPNPEPWRKSLKTFDELSRSRTQLYRPSNPSKRHETSSRRTRFAEFDSTSSHVWDPAATAWCSLSLLHNKNIAMRFASSRKTSTFDAECMLSCRDAPQPSVDTKILLAPARDLLCTWNPLLKFSFARLRDFVHVCHTHGVDSLDHHGQARAAAVIHSGSLNLKKVVFF